MSRGSSQRRPKPRAPPQFYETNSNEFATGSIMCIKLRNFMTFEKITISPSAGLNLIIGPNGSGKSTIVCAIGLGLGSSTAILARTSKLSGFIRHSCEMAKISILLKADTPFWIQRRIKADNSSVWRIRKINGNWKNSTQTEVVAKATQLHIQLDNLCMFLPQERVKEFSVLKPPQLLTATEQAINIDVYNDHQVLLKDFARRNELESKIQDLEANYSRYKSVVDQMQQEVARLRQVEECQANVKKYEMAIPWAIYQNSKLELKQISEEFNKEKANVERVTQNLQPLIQKIQELDREVKEFDSKNSNFGSEWRGFTNKAMNLADKRFQTQNRIDTSKNKLEQLSQDRDSLEKQVRELDASIAHSEEIMKNHESMDDIKRERQELQERIRSLQQQDQQVSNEARSISRIIDMKNNKIRSLEDRIRTYENQNNRMLRHIENNLRRPDIIKLRSFIDSNRNRFVGEVYGPICMEMKFKDARSANIVEMLVENHILLAFLADDEHDIKMLREYTKNNALERITLLHQSQRFSQMSQRKQPPPEDLSQFGFTQWAANTFTSPPGVAEMLNRMAELDRVPIGQGRLVRDNLDMLDRERFPRNNITRYVADNVVYYVRRSRYSTNRTIMSLTLKQSNIWRELSQGTEDVKNLKDAIAKKQSKQQTRRAKLEELKEQQRSLQNQTRDASKRIGEITERMRSASTMKQKILNMKDKRRDIQSNINSLPKRQEELKGIIEKSIRECANLNIERLNVIMMAYDRKKKRDAETHRRDIKGAELSEARAVLNHEKAQHEQLLRRIEDLKRRKESLKQERVKQKKTAEEVCPLTPENRAMLAELPRDINLLQNELERYRTRLTTLQHIDPNIARRHAEYNKKMNDTKEELDNLQAEYDRMSRTFSDRFVRWKQSMSVEVEKMNAAFKALMETCNYRGEVQLACDEADRIDTYKLNLMVAFNRAQPLTVLTSTRQSGGEKSVTTLMFLLALQDCTKFPFRVVDEINQGMDEQNDRNAFCQVMSYAMRKNQASQYFLVTPKLLQNLSQMDGITVMVVMNGPYVDDSLFQPITLDKDAGAESLTQDVF